MGYKLVVNTVQRVDLAPTHKWRAFYPNSSGIRFCIKWLQSRDTCTDGKMLILQVNDNKWLVVGESS
jgi:hypothetical protein